MKFDIPATTNPIDRLKVVGKATDRIDGPLKTTGRAPYAYERHDVAPGAAYGYVLGSAIAKGRITGMDLSAAKAAPGVLAIVTAENAGKLTKGNFNTANLLGGPEIEHYHQAIALVVAETFEQARAASSLIRVDYARGKGRFDLEAEMASATLPKEGFGGAAESKVGNFDGAFASAPVQLDARYTTPDHSHAMMEPHASTAKWEGDQLLLWTSNQMINWGKGDVARTLGLPKEKVRLMSPYVGGGFGGKLFVRTDAILAALGAKAAGRPVKVSLQRPLIANNTTHRPATIQRIRIGTTSDGKITAIGHESWSGDLPGGGPETAVSQTRLLYAGENRLTAMRLAVLDLPEGNAMRAPGEAPGMMALEIAMDEMAEKLGMDPVAFRALNDTQVDPEAANRPFSQRQLIQCMRIGADKFGWARRAKAPGAVREGRWLIGMGMAAAFRNNLNGRSGARVRLDGKGVVTVETDMTDIGTGTYAILGQIAGEMLGLPPEKILVQLGDTRFPPGSGSGGSWGAASTGSAVMVACEAIREQLAQQLGVEESDLTLKDGEAIAGNRRIPFTELLKTDLAETGHFKNGGIDEKFAIAMYGAFFVEVGVNAYTGETRVRRMTGAFGLGRALNAKTATSQCLGGMVWGIGSALTEELVFDPRDGHLVNHDLAEYHVPVNADVPALDVVLVDERDSAGSPLQAKGVGELGICGAAGAIANAIHHACGVRVRSFPITPDKLLEQLPEV